MPVQPRPLNAPQIRKQLLVALAELQREQLHHDLQTIQGGVRGLRQQAKLAGSVASVVALATTTFSLFRRGRSVARNGKPSFLSNMLQGARLASTVWSAFRSDPR